jgi:hypothetical protein
MNVCGLCGVRLAAAPRSTSSIYQYNRACIICFHCTDYTVLGGPQAGAQGTAYPLRTNMEAGGLHCMAGWWLLSVLQRVLVPGAACGVWRVFVSHVRETHVWARHAVDPRKSYQPGRSMCDRRPRSERRSRALGARLHVVTHHSLSRQGASGRAHVGYHSSQLKTHWIGQSKRRVPRSQD